MNNSIEQIIYDETEKRLDIMDKSDYEFPKKICKIDWIAIILTISVSMILILLCMLEVIG